MPRNCKSCGPDEATQVEMLVSTTSQLVNQGSDPLATYYGVFRGSRRMLAYVWEAINDT